MKNKYYSLKPILAKKAKYNVIFGERSNGKTYSVLKYGIEQYYKTGKQIAVVRRWRDDFVGKRGQVMFDGLVSNGEVARITEDHWTGVYYWSSRWYLCCYDGEGNRITDEKPFAYGFSISGAEHDKSTSYPDITTILFDEFITRQTYLPDEFVSFMNVCSTIIRQRNDVTIFMLGNTVNKYCPYFSEMGLKHIDKMIPGTIDVYKYGDSRLTVAVEYCATNRQGKDSDVYFAFDNPKLQMITGGEWEIDIYPHLPQKYKPKDVLLRFFIIFNRAILQCEVVALADLVFIFIHQKTTELKDPDHDIIFSPEYTPRPNWFRNITRPTTRVTQKIADLFKQDRVFYQDNETGEIVRNYLIFCGKSV